MNLSGRVSSEDMQRVKDMRGHGAYEDGFGANNDGGNDFSDNSSGGGGDSMDDFFDFGDDSGFGGGGGDSMDNLFDFGGDSGFGGGSDGGFGGGSGFGGGFDSGFGGGSGGGFGGGFDSGFGGGFGGGFGQQTQPQQPQQPAGPDVMDKMIDGGIETAKLTGSIMVEMFKSIRERTVDDFGYLSSQSIKVGVVLGVIGILSIIGGAVGALSFFSSLGLQLALTGGLLLSTGFGGIAVSALILDKRGPVEQDSAAIPEIPSSDENFTDQYEDNLGSELEDMFSDGFDDLFASDDDEDGDNSFSSFSDDFGDNDSDESGEQEEEDFDDDFDDDLGTIDYGAMLEEIGENQVITRQVLFNTFKDMFPTETPKFADKTPVEKEDELFVEIETLCLKALASLMNCNIDETNSYVEEATDSFFSYEIRLKRVPKVKKTDDLARELENYFREGPDDDSVNATVDIDGDFYRIIITKGASAIVTFGDIFKHKYCCDFFLNNKNKLPMVSGIDELGNVILDDAKNFDTMLIAGKPRSGKSWYVLSILMCLILFNSPEDVQFCIIDPKKSNLFKTIALLPHVCGLHDDTMILKILDDIIDVEAPRRKQLLANHRCDDIWALRKKGIPLPVLYVVIDEYMSVINNLDGEQKKEFNTKMQVLISQLPSLGIRLIFVPHRATGVVDKTNRTMLQFTAAVRANSDDVKDTLGINKWDRALTRPGDIAIMSSSMKSAKFVRGGALTTDDGDNTIFIETAAKAFYKMGVPIPDMHSLRIACNRDEDYVRKELCGENVIQFDAGNVGSPDDDYDYEGACARSQADDDDSSDLSSANPYLPEGEEENFLNNNDDDDLDFGSAFGSGSDDDDLDFGSPFGNSLDDDDLDFGDNNSSSNRYDDNNDDNWLDDPFGGDNGDDFTLNMYDNM